MRRRGTKTPGSTAIRSPQNSAQPSRCSSGSPATRRCDQGGQVGGGAGGVDEQARLVLGEDAAGGAQGGDDVGEREGRQGADGTRRCRHGSVAPVLDAHRQTASALRLEWGPTGAAAIGPGCDVAVVVDVLSFTTTVTVAADRGIGVLPHRWGDDGAARAVAVAHGATLAVGRSRARPGEVSLSPGSVRRAHDLRRLVLPSPNGSTISAGLGEVPAVVAVSLRNRRAVAAWLLDRCAADDLRVAVVCSGERWPDGTLRPAVEDLWGAGALVDLLMRADGATSPRRRPRRRPPSGRCRATSARRCGPVRAGVS